MFNVFHGSLMLGYSKKTQKYSFNDQQQNLTDQTESYIAQKKIGNSNK
jgi:hypothetical protein